MMMLNMDDESLSSKKKTEFGNPLGTDIYKSIDVSTLYITNMMKFQKTFEEEYTIRNVDALLICVAKFSKYPIGLRLKHNITHHTQIYIKVIILLLYIVSIKVKARNCCVAN